MHQKQEVLIVLDDPSPPGELSGDGRGQTTDTPLIHQSQCLLEFDIQPKPVADEDGHSKAALEGLNLSDSPSILPESPVEQKENPEPPPLRSDTLNRSPRLQPLWRQSSSHNFLSASSGPRCIALFDYEGEEEDELTFSQGDVIALQEMVEQEWGRGRIHGRVGIFPLSFAKVVEPLPQSAPDSKEVIGEHK